MADDPLDQVFYSSTSTGPAEPRHVMYGGFASSLSVYLLVAYGVTALVLIGYHGWRLFPDVLDKTVSRAAPPRGETLPQDEQQRPPDEPDPAPQPEVEEAEAAPTVPPGQEVATPPREEPATAPPVADSRAEATARIDATWELHLLALVALAGALGGLIHMFTSVGNYVGGRKLLRSWLIFYYLRPIVGAGLAVGIFFVLRMGVVGTTVAEADINVYGILTFSLLSGMFARQAIEKLAEVFENVFAKVTEKTASDSLQSYVLRGGGEDASLRLPPDLPRPDSAFAEEEPVDDRAPSESNR